MKPLILITNDDGIDSPGLLAAITAVKDLGDILVAAPLKQQTGMGRAFPRTPDQGIIIEKTLSVDDREIKAYGINGSPAYAVAHGVLELASRKPDLCLSGINYGENVGMVLTCSGTLGAVFEACSHDIPGIAVSRQVDLGIQRTSEYADLNWEKEIEITRYWISRVLDEGICKGACMLNINIPVEMEDITNYRITKQSRQNYFEFIKPKPRDFNKPFELEAKLNFDVGREASNTDIYAIGIDKVTSVTPLTWDMSI